MERLMLPDLSIPWVRNDWPMDTAELARIEPIPTVGVLVGAE